MTSLKKSRILEEVYESAQGLCRSGAITKRHLAELEAICHIKIEAIPPTEIRAIREKSRISQSVFAAILNTSVSTVQKWEVGSKKPSGPSLKLLSIIQQKGLDIAV